jgi:hypothetical protein
MSDNLKNRYTFIRLFIKPKHIKMKTNFLKLNSFALVFAAGLILVSCSKSSTPKDDLIGTWSSASYTVTTTVNGTPLLQYLTNTLGLPADQAQAISTLVNGGVQQALPGSIQIKSDYTFTATSTGGTDTGTWSLSSDNKKLTIDPSNGDPMTFDVISLTSSNLHLQWSQTESEDLNSDGTPETLDSAIDLTLSK